FHRLDLRVHHTWGDVVAQARAVLGYDKTYSMGTDFHVLVAEPALHLTWKPAAALTLTGGIEGSLHKGTQRDQLMSDANAFAQITSQLDTFTIGSALAEALWRPTRAWLIRPGVRGDVYADGTATRSAVDPRLTVRYQLAHRDLPDVPPDSDDSAIWLKGSAGIYHQPPRFVLPLPGLDMMPIQYGLLRSFQTSLGVEIPLEERFQFNVEGFFNYMDPTIFDLQINNAAVITSPN